MPPPSSRVGFAGSPTCRFWGEGCGMATALQGASGARNPNQSEQALLALRSCLIAVQSRIWLIATFPVIRPRAARFPRAVPWAVIVLHLRRAKS